MGADVRFTGRQRSMWRHINNPVAFFSDANGWKLTHSTVTELSHNTIILSRYTKRQMVAWACYTHEKGWN